MTRHTQRESSAPRRYRQNRPWTVWLAAMALLLPAAAFAQPAEYGSASYDTRGYGDSNDSYDDDSEAPAGYDTGYSYLRTLDGSATLIQGGEHDESGERSVAEINQPVLAGDRLWVAPGSRLEVALSDGNLLRVDGDSEVLLEQLAFSPETDHKATTLRLVRGNLQLVVTGDSLGEQLPRLDTGNATVYPQDFGTYRLTTDGLGWTELVVRRGRAELVTDGGSVEVRADQRALVEGDRQPWTDVKSAGAFDSLERWAADLDRGYEEQEVPYVDEELRYAAAPMARHGSWVTVEGSRAWRPHVEAGWRPYWHGRWAYSPAGLIWVSSEPWGWVPYHYGSWDYSPAYGWVWLPGRRFSPGWVYWHWGSAHVAWVPVGYYARHWHRRYHHGFRFGVYGWAGGSWDHYGNWVFCPRGYFGTRYQRRHVLDGHGYHRRHGGREVPRGILTTDTRRLGPRGWRHGDDALRALRTRPRRGGGVATAELPDVTAFVDRRGDLPSDVRRRVAVDRTGGTRVAGTPLDPGSKAPDRRAALPRVRMVTDGKGTERADVRPRGPVRLDDRVGRGGVGRRSAVIRGEAGKPGGGQDAPRGDRGPRARGSEPAQRPAVIRRDRGDRSDRSDRPAQRPAASGPKREGPDAWRVRSRAANPAAGKPPGSARAPAPRVQPRVDRPQAARPRAERPRIESSAPRGGKADVRSRSEVYRAPAPRRPTSRSDAGAAPRVDRRPAPRTSERASPPARGRVERSAPRTAPAPRKAPSTVYRSPGPAQRPTVRRSPGPAPRPTVRRSPSTTQRPTVRRSPQPDRRPTVQRSPSSRSAPSRSRATVQRSPTPRPQARSAPRSQPRQPSATSRSRSSAGSRSSAKSSGRGGSSRSTARRAKPRPRND